MPFNAIGFLIGQNQAERQFTSRGKPVDSSSTQRAALLSGMLFPVGLVLAIDAAARDAEAATPAAATTGVSGTTEPVAVPTVVGRSFAVANRILRQFQLTTPESPQKFFSDKPVNEVLTQNPEAEQPVPTGTSVTLTVSKGPPPAKELPVALENELVNTMRQFIAKVDAQPTAGGEVAPVPKK